MPKQVFALFNRNIKPFFILFWKIHFGCYEPLYHIPQTLLGVPIFMSVQFSMHATPRAHYLTRLAGYLPSHIPRMRME